jgi:hypothetical protein
MPQGARLYVPRPRFRVGGGQLNSPGCLEFISSLGCELKLVYDESRNRFAIVGGCLACYAILLPELVRTYGSYCTR